ncbi:MAG: HAMP domain-containing sensor histidine kinase [Verrucomicrobiales bacterium]
MQRARFPLYLKVLCLFLLNVALLATALPFLLRAQLGLGLDTLLSGSSGEKIERALRLVSDELRERDRDSWDAQLARFSEAYGVTFTLFHSSGQQIAGVEQILPDEILATLNEYSPGAENGRPPPRRPRLEQQPNPLFLKKHNGYWLGARVQIEFAPARLGGARRPGKPPRPGTRPNPPPDILMVFSKRLGGNDLFPDPRSLIAASIAIVWLCALFWIPFVRGLTHSLARIRDATHHVAAGKFDTLVSESRSDEIGQLGQSINQMSQRLKGFVDGQQRFLGDIAHELCSPIARMQMALGVLEQRATDEQRPRVDDVREELQHMADMVNELLSFSKASLSPESADPVIIVLAPFLREVAEREIGSRDAEIGLEHSDGLAVVADRQLLARAIGNLLRNAVRYGGDSPAISLDACDAGDGKIDIIVRDFGPGVSEEDLPYLLDPFYRPDKARTRERGGTGLGLAIVKTCVEACGGSVSYRNADPGFEVTLTLDAPRFG